MNTWQSDWSGIIGQNTQITRLRREIVTNRLSHAYLLEGGTGFGKQYLGRMLIKARLCQQQNGDICNCCPSCLQINNNSHPDLLELPRETTNLRRARFVAPTVETAADKTDPVLHPPVNEFLSWKPRLSNHLTVLIPDCERLGDEAANAFLKTLEEPPSSSLIVLTCSVRERLPQTIISRCRRLGLSPLTISDIVSQLTSTGLDTTTALIVAESAEGSLGNALSLAGDPDISADWSFIAAVLNLSENTADSGNQNRINGLALVRGLLERISLFKNVAQKRKNALRLLETIALQIRLGARRGQVSALRLSQELEAVYIAAGQIAANVSPELALTRLAFALVNGKSGSLIK